MLGIARSSICQALSRAPSAPPKPASAHLSEPRGVFVTLRLEGELRGCIGFVDPRSPLLEAISEVAVKAATEDPRFAPVTMAEVDGLEVEISVLSPLTLVHSAEEVTVGMHGVMVDAGYTRGLLLPHVATEYGWDREEFLNHACLKAGLPASRWRSPGVAISTFTTETFSDEDVAAHHGHARS